MSTLSVLTGQAAKPAADLGGRVFLVIDDLESMRQVTVNQLRLLGAGKILTAHNGFDGLRTLRNANVDVVLSDWNMPVMDGMALLKAMRADPKLRAVPLIMITAEADREHVQEAIAQGVTSLLLKPYSSAQLENRVIKALSWKLRAAAGEGAITPLAPALTVSGAAMPTGAAPPTAVARTLPTLLLVDDAPDNLLLLSTLFKSEYRIRLAPNGAKALEICLSEQPPDLVLLDIMMPDMDGFEVARRMRAHPSAEGIPVIFVTAMDSRDAHHQGLALGAVDFITKPIDPDMVKLRVRNFMRYVQMRRDQQADYDNMVEAAHLRGELERMVRHDARPPLLGALGVLHQLLADAGLTPAQHAELQLAEQGCLQALDQINLSTELYRIETGQFQLNAQPLALAGLLQAVTDRYQAELAAKSLRLVWRVEGAAGTELRALGDASLCHCLFDSLIKNAVQAAPAGSQVEVTLQDQSPLQVRIRNRGAVPAALRERFFDKYVTHNTAPGAGLGTYAARLLVQAQHGQLQLEVSDAQDSTTLIVRLPRA